MEALDPQLQAVVHAHADGRYDDALADLLAVFERVLASAELARVNWFITMFEWKMLVEEHVPARAAFARLRDTQAERLLEGDVDFADGRRRPHSRFALIEDMNSILGDTCSTWELFVRLEALAPEQARRAAWRALPAIVEAGDFARAERYLPRDPLKRLGELNELALRFPLLPPGGSAPGLAAELSNFMQDVRLCATTFDGLGRHDEAARLRAAALAGLESAELRAMAEREAAEPGAIMRALSAHQMAMEEDGIAPPPGRSAQSPPG